MNHSEIIAALQEKFGAKVTPKTDAGFDPCVVVAPADLVDVCRFLRDDPRLAFGARRYLRTIVELRARSSDGAIETMPLREGPLSGFCAGYEKRLARLGVAPRLYPFAVEIPDRINLATDDRACSYDAAWAGRFFRALLQADRLLKRFRGGFVGKASPVHFFWGGFDMAVTRFSGRLAPPHPGGIPNVGDWVMREAYSHEVSSAGFWPGDARLREPAFYSYAYPEPPAFKQARVRPAAARYEPALGEFVLPYRAVRASPTPDADVLAFLQDTYAAAADLAHWDRRALGREGAEPGAGRAVKA